MEEKTCNAAVKAIMKLEGVTQTQLAERMNMSQGTISASLNANRMSFEKFSKILDALGYAVYIGKQENDGDILVKYHVT